MSRSAIYSCIECNKDFYRFVEEGYPDPKFCTTDCKLEYTSKINKTQIALVTRNCQACSKQFECLATDTEQYCSQECKERIKNAEKNEDTLTTPTVLSKSISNKNNRNVDITCASCKVHFQRYVSKGYPQPKYCSRACSNVGRAHNPEGKIHMNIFKGKPAFTCEFCHTRFERYVQKGATLPRFCTIKCFYENKKTSTDRRIQKALESVPTIKSVKSANKLVNSHCIRCARPMPEHPLNTYFCSRTCKPTYNKQIPITQTAIPVNPHRVITLEAHEQQLKAQRQQATQQIDAIKNKLQERIDKNYYSGLFWRAAPTLISLATAGFVLYHNNVKAQDVYIIKSKVEERQSIKQ